MHIEPEDVIVVLVGLLFWALLATSVYVVFKTIFVV
jgi:hypothetical protein